MIPPIAPIITACPIEGVNGSAVIATKPAIAPLSLSTIFVWLFVALLTIIQANTPPAGQDLC